MSESKSPHDGKHFVIQKGKAQCNQGDQFPQFKVTTHQKHYWNNAEGQKDFLAVTEQDLQFNPQGPSFGKCKLKPSSGGYLPCTYAPAGIWQKTYDKVKVMGNSCVTEISELLCSTGGKISVMEHGQTAAMSKQNVKNADPQEQHNINPFINIKEFQQDVADDEADAY